MAFFILPVICPLVKGNNMLSALAKYVINRLIHDLFHIALVISPRGRYQGLVLITRAIWKRPLIYNYIGQPLDILFKHIYSSTLHFARADNMLLPFTRGQITCYCPRNMLLPRRQITRRKSRVCFYYTCKFGVISIKYVINIDYDMVFSISALVSSRDSHISLVYVSFDRF
jgi:hypothetical protein